MTDFHTLLGLLDRWVTVTHPGTPRRVSHGRLVMVMEQPSIGIELPGGGQETFPAAFHVEAADPTAVLPPAADQPRPWTDLRTSGLLWLINRTAFHPRGLALALLVGDNGEFDGWSLLTNDDGEPWQFDPTTDYDGHRRAEATLATALRPAGRLLACGWCYEEHGEEVHPHPECPISSTAPVVHAPHLGRAGAVPGTIDQSALCCVCGGGRVAHENYQGQLFCWLCADCDCGIDGLCIRTGLHRPVPASTCTASFQEGFHGHARCERHHAKDPHGRLGPWHEGRSQDGSTLFWKDGDNGATPHRTAADACNARCEHPHRGRLRCDQDAGHYTSDNCTHGGWAADGHRVTWRDGDRNSTPHTPPENAPPGSRPRRITIDPPDGATISAARHLDQSEGPVRVGCTVDTATRSAINRVLAYIEKAHNSPPDTVRTPCPDTDTTVRTHTGPDTDTTALTSTDTVRTACPDSEETPDPDTVRTTCPDTVRTPRPDTDADSPGGFRFEYTARVPRRQMGAALLEAFGLLSAEQAKQQPDTTAAPAADVDESADPGEHLTLGPDGITDADREWKTIREVFDTELHKPDEHAVKDLVTALSRALQAMPRYAQPARLSAAEQDATPVNDERLGRPEHAHARLGLAREVLLDDGYFTDDEIGPDLAPRLVEWLSHHRGLKDQAVKEVETLRARVGELADALADAIGRFTIPAVIDNQAHVRTGYTPVTLVDQWRTVHAGKSLPNRTFPQVQGRCPACTRKTLFLGSGGWVTCSNDTCTEPDAAACTLATAYAQAGAHERALRHAAAYEAARIDLQTAVKYIEIQVAAGPLSPLRDGRSRILTSLTTWVKDPGPLNPSDLRTDA